jgi:hypothetical protein
VAGKERRAVLGSGADASTDALIFGETAGDRNWHDYASEQRHGVILRNLGGAEGVFWARTADRGGQSGKLSRLRRPSSYCF